MANIDPLAAPKGGLKTKFYLVCDGGGLPIHLPLKKGTRADISQAKQCPGSFFAEGAMVIADRLSDANHLRNKSFTKMGP